MLAGSQHESKSHLISQGPNKLQMHTVKAKLSTNQHSEEVNSLCTCRDKTAVQRRTASCIYKGCGQTAGKSSRYILQSLC